jgi:hypothetical protein
VLVGTTFGCEFGGDFNAAAGGIDISDWETGRDGGAV